MYEIESSRAEEVPFLLKGPKCHIDEPESHIASFSRVNISSKADNSLGLNGFPKATPAPSFSA